MSKKVLNYQIEYEKFNSMVIQQTERSQALQEEKEFLQNEIIKLKEESKLLKKTYENQENVLFFLSFF